jgi:hypothetical protein
MKETAKALLSKNKNEPSAARALYVSLDNADNVIEGGPGCSLWFFRVPYARFMSVGLLPASLEPGKNRILTAPVNGSQSPLPKGLAASLCRARFDSHDIINHVRQ